MRCRCSGSSSSLEVGALLAEIPERGPVDELELENDSAVLLRDDIQRGGVVDEQVPELVRSTRRAMRLEADALACTLLGLLALGRYRQLFQLLVSDIDGCVEKSGRLQPHCVPGLPESCAQPVLVHVDGHAVCTRSHRSHELGELFDCR